MNATNSTDLSDEEKVALGLEFGAYALAVCIIILLSCIERNKKGKHPGIVIPVDLLSDDKITYVYAAAFGSASSSILQLILSVDTESFDVASDVKPWIQIPVWLLLSVIVSLKFYPIFAAISFRYQAVGTGVGIIYCGYLLSEIIYQLVQVEIQTKDLSDIITTIPILVCYVILLYYFFYRAFIGVKRFVILRHCHDEIHPIDKTIGYERAYVKWLLKPNKEREECDTDKEVDTSVYRKLNSYKTGVKDRLNVNTHLKTSPRVIATFIVSGMILLQLGISLCISYPTLRKTTESYLFDIFANSTALPQIKLLINVTDVSFYVSFITSTFVMVVYVVLIYRNYQNDMKKMYNGDFSFLPKKVRRRDNKDFVESSLRYSGTQIAYMFWCYVILFVSILLMCYVIAYLLILPLMGKVSEDFLFPVKALLPIFAARYLFYIFQTVLVNRYFLQNYSIKKRWSGDTQRVLALNNRKMFSVLTYFMFFFHVIIGFFACISRILFGAAIGILTVARIDRSLLPRGYEHLDNGYSTYVGLIMLELYHRNPILIVFCDELQSIIRNKPENQFISLEPADHQIGYQRSVFDRIQYRQSIQIRNRWHKAVTLINNPCTRKRQVNKNSRNLVYHYDLAPNIESEG